MDNQHRKITGYRELTPEDVALMNDIKVLGNAALVDVLQRVSMHIAQQRLDVREAEKPLAEIARIDAAQPERWIAIARTHFQEGLMALTRAVAQPGFF